MLPLTLAVISTLHTLVVPLAPAYESSPFVLGTAKGPHGVIQADGLSLLRDGKRWTPVMGEFHYARYPESEWREELLKMKAGGIDVIATYVFWIHHEEVEGKWRWDGQRSLRRFVALCGELQLPCVVRLGPWCHGEVRNGGLPDWVVKQGKTRRDDPEYLKHVQVLYGQIAAQLKGLLWKEGGPVFAVQLENEYGGRAEHLLTLKRIARECGIDTPLYTRTGWPRLSSPMPFGEILPLYGNYPEGFWDRTVEAMPASYWRGFTFDARRSDDEIANERQRNQGDEEHAQRYPYLTCEMGGGMQVSYHRRVRIDPRDIDSLALTRIGSGSNLPGYYMAHGGTNPDGELTTLQEAQANREWNDLPVKTYDFQTLLGEFGQTREQYHRLRPIHLFLREWGGELATMPSILPEERPQSKDDDGTLRWAVRSDGRSGYVFVNNYQRLHAMPAKPQTQLRVELPTGAIEFPEVTVPADSAFFWPFNMSLGGIRLRYATAQPVCRLGDTYVFAATGNVPVRFAFDGARIEATRGHVSGETVSELQPSREVAIRVVDGSRRASIVVLSEEDARRLYKGRYAGQERLVLSSAGVVFDGEHLRLRTDAPGSPSVSVWPAPARVAVGGKAVASQPDGLFTRFELPWKAPTAPPVRFEKVRSAGPAREIPKGSQGVAEAPGDEAFAAAAEYRIHVSPHAGRRIAIRYAGDVARLYQGDRLLTDNFYNGTPFEFGTWRGGKDLRLQILPLRADAPIMLLDRPPFGGASSLAELIGVDIIEERTLVLE